VTDIPRLFIALGPNNSISTIMLPCIEVAAVLPPPDIIVPYLDLSGEVAPIVLP